MPTLILPSEVYLPPHWDEKGFPPSACVILKAKV
jgi:hypothetical protein